MRYVAAVLIIACLPMIMAWLRANSNNRRIALAFLGLGFFLNGVVQIEVSPIVWPAWAGTVKGVTISLMDAVALALIITRNSHSRSFPLLAILVLYVAAAIVAMLSASVPMASFFYIFQILRLILLFIAVVPELHDHESLRKLLQGFAVGLVVQAGYVISEKLHGVVQATGTMAHQNALGIMVELTVLPLVAALLAGERSRVVTAGVIGGLIVVAGGGSRATAVILLCGLLALLVLSLIQSSNPTKLRVLGAGFLVSLLIAPLGYKTLSNRFDGKVNFSEDEQRTAMENAAHMMSADHFFGVGSNLYVTVANTKGYSQKANVTWGGGTRAAPVHNSFLLARAETGILGQLLFIALFLGPIYLGLRHAFRFRRSFDGSLALGCAVALGGVAFHSQYEFATHTLGPQGLMFINIAIISGLVSYRRSRPAARRAARNAVSPVNRPAKDTTAIGIF